MIFLQLHPVALCFERSRLRFSQGLSGMEIFLEGKACVLVAFESHLIKALSPYKITTAINRMSKKKKNVCLFFNVSSCCFLSIYIKQSQVITENYKLQFKSTKP